MSELEKARLTIDEVDREMAALFERRMAAAAGIAAYKQAHGLPVLDAGREAAVIDKNTARLQNAALSDYYRDFLRHLMSLSRAWQTAILGQNSIAYQGAEGGFGHTVAALTLPHAAAQSCPTFAAVFDAVESGEAACGVVPFENSTTGDVSGVLDLLYTHDVFITGMVDLPVTQNLLGVPGAQLADVKTVTSHVQALEQSKRFIKTLGAAQLASANTAVAAKEVAEKGDASLAAIGSLEAAARYGLTVLARDIAAEADNTTRFLLIAKTPGRQGERFSLLFTLDNTVGSLARVIEVIAAEGFNMESIKSRPFPKNPWQYYFYAELVGAPAEEKTQALLENMRSVCHSVRMLGVYKRTTASAPDRGAW